MVIKRVRFVVPAVVLALAGALYAWRGADPQETRPPSAAPEPRQRSQIEREAIARFAGSAPRVKLPDGTTLAPSNDEHALAIKVNAYKSILAREAERRDPTFKLKAEAELERRKPRHATLTWQDESGSREAVFVVEDSSSCGLPDGEAELQLPAAELAHHPCLSTGGSLGTELDVSVRLEPVNADETLWRELLRDTMRGMAAEAHLASSEHSEAP